MTDVSQPAATTGTVSAPESQADHSNRIRHAIDSWFAAHIHDSPVSRSVDALNHLRARLAHLEVEIVQAFKTEI